MDNSDTDSFSFYGTGSLLAVVAAELVLLWVIDTPVSEATCFLGKHFIHKGRITKRRKQKKMWVASSMTVSDLASQPDKHGKEMKVLVYE